ncbi:MAG: Carboxynorspermidine/carboxyspermidine decarboxylase [Lentisphaerae bacterium ADurb.Bin242]|nr:MAG: Carboxynorspermidine/carboxyspermidine decarboxylase [Lentisphaerae bacterium ADurb.Bin242]
MTPLPLEDIKPPCFVVDRALLRRNLEILGRVRRETGVKILLAQKAFSMFSVYPLLAGTLDGTCASSPHEARLGREEFGKEVTAFAAAYSRQDLEELLSCCNHVIFNSFSQWKRFRDLTGKAPGVKFGLRCNPEHSEGQTPLYDPCAPKSRLGIRHADFAGESLEGITGLHVHNLCEQNADAFERTLAVFEKTFADIIPQMQWINFGGGHHITRPDYDVPLLCRLLNGFRKRWNISELYLEPGEAVALDAGYLVATVLDIVRNEMDIAILDTSAEAHMPDVLEMPYRPNIIGAGQPSEKKCTYRLAGHSCLAGDVIGDYSFDEKLEIGRKVVFLDMAHYTMVKTNTFNGLQLPSIALFDSQTHEYRVVREFDYSDFKSRLS